MTIAGHHRIVEGVKGEWANKVFRDEGISVHQRSYDRENSEEGKKKRKRKRKRSMEKETKKNEKEN
jgi:hypothetical protein